MALLSLSYPPTSTPTRKTFPLSTSTPTTPTRKTFLVSSPTSTTSSTWTTSLKIRAFLPPFMITRSLNLTRGGSRSLFVCMAPKEERMTRRSPLDFPIWSEWERPKPGRRPDIFPQFSPMKTPLPPPLPADPPEEDEEEEEGKKEEEEENPETEEPEKHTTSYIHCSSWLLSLHGQI